MKSLLFLMSLLLGIGSSVAADIDLAPVKQWVERTSKLKTFTASFTQLRFLKTVRKPLESSGTISFAAPDSIRWQSAKLIATMKSGDNLTIQRPEKMEAEVIGHSQLQQKADDHGVAFLESGFPRSFEEFQKKFTVTAVTKNGAMWQVETKLAEGSNPIVRKFILLIHDGSFTLGGLQFFFRDGSRIESTFTNLKENPPLAADYFKPDLKGYTIKNVK